MGEHQGKEDVSCYIVKAENLEEFESIMGRFRN